VTRQGTANTTTSGLSLASISKRKRPTKSVAIAINAAAQFEPELLLLGPQAQDFCLSQRITTVKVFLSASPKDMATALAKETECTFSMALRKVERWKKQTRQRQETRMEQPVGLHPTFEVFNIDKRSFFAAMSIATPYDLLQYEDLAQAYMDWRHNNNKRRSEAKDSHKLYIPVESMCE